MTDAIAAVRCMSCGWTLTSHPDYAPRTDRWLECDNSKCSEHGKRYALPTVQLQPYRAPAASEI